MYLYIKYTVYIFVCCISGECDNTISWWADELEKKNVLSIIIGVCIISETPD